MRNKVGICLFSILLLFSSKTESFAAEPVLPEAAVSKGNDIPTQALTALAKKQEMEPSAVAALPDNAPVDPVLPETAAVPLADTVPVPSVVQPTAAVDTLSPISQTRDTSIEDSGSALSDDKAESSDLKPTIRTGHAVPAPYLDEKPEVLPKGDISSREVQKTGGTVPVVWPLSAISVPFGAVTGSTGEYYTSASLSPLLTINLLSVGAFFLVLGTVLLQPRILARWFITIEYLEPGVKQNWFGGIRRNAKRFLTGIPQQGEEDAVFHRLSI